MLYFNSSNWKKPNVVLYLKQLRHLSFSCLHFVHVFLLFGFDIYICMMILQSIITIRHFCSLSVSHRLSFLDFYSTKQQSRCTEDKMGCFRLTVFKPHRPRDDASAPFQLQGRSAGNISSFFPHTHPLTDGYHLSLALFLRRSSVQKHPDIPALSAVSTFRAGTLSIFGFLLPNSPHFRLRKNLLQYPLSNNFTLNVIFHFLL